MRRIVLAVAESRHTEDTVAIRAGWVTTEGDGKKLERVLLLVKVEALDPPKHLVFARRCRENRGRNRHRIGRSQSADSVLAVHIDVEIEVANLRDALLRSFAAA